MIQVLGVEGSMLSPMHEWTDDFILNAQHQLVSMVEDCSYNYGADPHDCSAMLLWMLIRLNPDAGLDASVLNPRASEASSKSPD